MAHENQNFRKLIAARTVLRTGVGATEGAGATAGSGGTAEAGATAGAGTTAAAAAAVAAGAGARAEVGTAAVRELDPDSRFILDLGRVTNSNFLDPCL